MEWKKIAGAAWVPLVALALLSLSRPIVLPIGFQTHTGDLIGSVLSIAGILIYIYAGYSVVKKYQVYLYGAAIGAMLGFASSVINIIVDVTFMCGACQFSPHSPIDLTIYFFIFLLTSIPSILTAMVLGQMGGFLGKRDSKQLDYLKPGNLANSIKGAASYGKANFKSIIKVASIPIAVNLVLDLIVAKMFSNLPSGPSTAGIGGIGVVGYLLAMFLLVFPILLLIKGLILLGGGYFTVKKYGLNLNGAAITGALVGTVDALCLFTLILLGVGNQLLVALIIGGAILATLLVGGTMLAAIGGLIAQRRGTSKVTNNGQKMKQV